MATRKSLIFPKFHMTKDTKVKRYEIIATKTLLKDTIVEKTTQSRPRFKFVSFMRRKRHKANTTEDSKRGIFLEFVIK